MLVHGENATRTIAGLLAEGVDPEKYGFKGISTKHERIKDDILKRFIFMDMHIPYWKDIQRRWVENRRNNSFPKKWIWIYDYNFDHVNMTFSKQLKIGLPKTRSLLSKIKHTVIKMTKITFTGDIIIAPEQLQAITKKCRW
ncbi:MAG: hypothetical protein ACLUVG_05465 [Phocaeicola vulgatus]